MGTRNTIYLDSGTNVEVRPPREGRTYFFAQNLSANDVYFDEGTMATSENGIAIGAGQFLELRRSDGQSVPQGNCWFRGSVAPGNPLQRVLIKEG